MEMKEGINVVCFDAAERQMTRGRSWRRISFGAFNTKRNPVASKVVAPSNSIVFR